MSEEFDINEAAGKLQSEFATVDLMTRRQGRIPGAIEFLILKMEDLKLKMYQEIGHRRPHLHVDYGSQRHAASYAVDTGERLEGDSPANMTEPYRAGSRRIAISSIAFGTSRKRANPLMNLFSRFKSPEKRSFTTNIVGHSSCRFTSGRCGNLGKSLPPEPAIKYRL